MFLQLFIFEQILTHVNQCEKSLSYKLMYTIFANCLLLLLYFFVGGMGDGGWVREMDKSQQKSSKGSEEIKFWNH